MSDDIRALVFDGPHRFHIEQRPTPVPAEGEVLIRMAHVGICGSDLHGYTGESGRRVPGMVMGHEASGWIEAVGEGVSGLEPGTEVTFNPALPCDGTCGHTVENHCARLRVIGVTPEIQGAFADAMVAPAERVVPLDGLSLVWGAAVEPMAVALQAARRAGIAGGERVLVVGGGMIGQAIAQTARLEGAADVTISDPMPERRSLAEACGFQAVRPDEVDDTPRYDVAIDAVGISATAAAAIRSVPKGGTVCFVGLGLAEITIPLFDVVVPERVIVGSFCYTHEVFTEAADHLRNGRLDLDPLIGGVEPFEEIAAAFEDLATGARRDAKIMMSTGAAPPS